MKRFTHGPFTLEEQDGDHYTLFYDPLHDSHYYAWELTTKELHQLAELMKRYEEKED